MFIHLNELSRLFLPAVLAAAAATQAQTCTLASPQQNSTAPAVETAAERTPAEPTPEPATASTSTAALTQWVSCPELLQAPPRGMSCLHCLQPEAESQAAALVQLLLESCLENIAVNYLVDGSFSYNEALLRSHIEALSSGGRKLTLLIYFANGPTQRKYRNALLDGFGTGVSPAEFRSLIRSDEAVRESFRELVRGVAPVLEYAAGRGAELLLVPMLEDNLDRESFISMAELLRESLPDSLPYRLGRNPCPTCSDGADGSIPEGMFRETHNVRGAGSLRNGVVSNDGEWSALEAAAQRDGRPELSLGELKKARDRAAAGGNVFILWSASRQGRYATATGGMPRQSAEERNYAFPSDEERRETLIFLRGNSR